MSPDRDRTLTRQDRAKIRRGWKLTQTPEGNRWELPGPKYDHARTDIGNVTRVSRSTAPRTPRDPSPWDQTRVDRGMDALYTGKEVQLLGFRLEDVVEVPSAEAPQSTLGPVVDRTPKPHQNEKA